MFKYKNWQNPLILPSNRKRQQSRQIFKKINKQTIKTAMKINKQTIKTAMEFVM